MYFMINGEKTEMCKPLTVTELLKERDIESPDLVSVELNQEILAKDVFTTTILQESDSVEFLYFMGGGSGKHEGYRLKI